MFVLSAVYRKEPMKRSTKQHEYRTHRTIILSQTSLSIKTKARTHYGELRKAYLEMRRPMRSMSWFINKLFEHYAKIDTKPHGTDPCGVTGKAEYSVTN